MSHLFGQRFPGANEISNILAAIFLMTLPRWSFTVMPLMPRLNAICLLTAPAQPRGIPDAHAVTSLMPSSAAACLLSNR